MSIAARRWIQTVSVALALIPLNSGTPALAADLPPATAFARLPATGLVRLSPDGRNVAWADFSVHPPVISLYDLARQDYLRHFRPDDEGKLKLRDLHWADNDTVLMTVSVSDKSGASASEAIEIFRILALDTSGGPARLLLAGDGYRSLFTSAQLVRTQIGRPDVVMMSSYDWLETAYRMETGSRLTGGRKDSGIVYSLFEVDTRTGTGKRIEGGTPYTGDWIVDRAGRAVARSEWNPDQQDYRIFIRQARGWTDVHVGKVPDDLRPAGLAVDGQAVIAIGARGGELERAWRIPFDGGEMTAVAEYPEDVEYVVPDRNTGAVAGLQLGGLVPTIRWLDPRLDAIHRAIAKAFTGKQITIYDWSEDYGRVLARVESASSAPIYYLVDLKRGAADTIGEAYPELVGAVLGERQETSFRARDGIEIPAYLTLPPGRPPKTLPLVVFPHGGPYARDDSGFDWWTQFMATRGYAVLQPQFRGSTGFGTLHRKAGEREWGQAMQDDLLDGVTAMVERGIADPSRVCLVGASYGGYAALSGVAFSPDRFACAASINGISDLPGMYGYLRSHYGVESDTLAEWKRMVGRPVFEDLEQVSPARAASQIRAPILLIHGTDDSVVPYAQARVFAKALQNAGKPYELVTLKDEDHWLSSARSRLQILEALERFLGQHLAASANDPQ